MRPDRDAGLQIALRSQDAKYIATFRADTLAELRGATPVRHELYDLRDDPGELRNLLEGDDVVPSAFSAALRGYLRATQELAPASEGDAILDEKALEELRSLGYIEQ